VDQALALFGRPAFVTGFYRALRGIKSKEDDTFTLILQYSGDQDNLVVTVKTTVINKMPQPLKYFIRGYNGTYIKYGEDPQEGQTGKGMTPADPGYGVESPEIHGILTSNKHFHEDQVKVTGWAGDNDMYHGKFPTTTRTSSRRSGARRLWRSSPSWPGTVSGSSSSGGKAQTWARLCRWTNHGED
jgi:hypothetical protein